MIANIADHLGRALHGLADLLASQLVSLSVQVAVGWAGQ